MLNFVRMMFSLLVISVREFPGQDEVALCRQWIASCPSEIQGVRAAMGRHERFRSELAAGFEAQKKKANLDGDVLLSVGSKTRRQPRGVRPPPRGAASGDQGT